MRLTATREEEIEKLPPTERIALRDQMCQAIVDSDHPKQLILSGAGTGKTFLFKEKVAKWVKAGVPPEKILITSFINFIVNDLKAAFKPKYPEVEVLTLHKLAKATLHKYLQAGGKFENALTHDFQIALSCDEQNIAEDLMWLYPKECKSVKSVHESLSDYFVSPNKHKQPAFYKAYLETTSFYDTVTFKDSIPRALQALKEKPEISGMQKVIVDEYQDFNPAEQSLVNQLFAIAGSGIVAGDDDQSIYLARGADCDGIIKVHANADWENNNLPFCSRTQSKFIIDSASVVCRKQKRVNRIDKSYISLTDGGTKVKIADLSQSRSDFWIEAEYILKEIDVTKLTAWKEDYPAYLILGKTGSHLKKIASILEERLKVKVGMKAADIYEDEAVQLLYSYIQLLGKPDNNLAFRRLLGLSDIADQKEVLIAALSAGGFQKLKNDFTTSVQAKLEEIKGISELEIDIESKLTKIVEALGISLKNPNIEAFITSVKDKKSFSQILNQLGDMAVEQKEKERGEIQASPIQCLTIWGSKGLKAETVFVLGMEEGYLPKHNGAPSDEEINLAYVAMTRAVSELHLLTCKSRYDGVHNAMQGKSGPLNKSVFLSWLPAEHVEVITRTKKDFLPATQTKA